MSKWGEGLMPLSWERLWKSSTELCRLVIPADDGREEPEEWDLQRDVLYFTFMIKI